VGRGSLSRQQHGEATIVKMRNCVEVGNVVAGVICADGQLGPVGRAGVVI